ncbi:pilus assembly FimT family protein [Marinobacterium sp. YM272]|uniref:pilus assembly FimT family protein n=1 Tax=Marinobacterium sp. YM272 TaxID=3421654 RepID=UPI003D7F5F87
MPAICRKNRGFTLIELLVVLVILSISTGMAVLALGKGTERNLYDSRDRMVEWLDDLAARATLENSSFRLRIEDGGQVEISQWLGSDWVQVDHAEAPALGAAINIWVESDARHSGEHLVLPTGQVLPALHLRMSDGESSTSFEWPSPQASDGGRS